MGDAYEESEWWGGDGHTGDGKGLQSLEKAYQAWKELMSENKKNRKKCDPPVASLVEFFSGTESRSDLD